jgi:hypothetical protein
MACEEKLSSTKFILVRVHVSCHLLTLFLLSYIYFMKEIQKNSGQELKRDWKKLRDPVKSDQCVKFS